MDREGDLETARAAFAHEAWGEAWSELSTAADSGPLGWDDLERLATAAALTGRDRESDDAWLRAYRLGVDSRDAGTRFARCFG